jgi:hypothetical protein
MTLPLDQNYEEGTAGTTMTTGNTGGSGSTAFSAIGTGTGVTVAFDSDAMHGSVAGKTAVGTTSAAAYQQWSSAVMGTISTVSYGRAYFKVASLTLTGDAIIAFLTGSTFGGGIQLGGVSAGKLNFQNTAFGQTNTFTTTLSANTWYRLEWQITPGASAAGRLVVKLFLGDSTTALETQTSTTGVYGSSTSWNAIRFGWGAAGGNHANQPAINWDDLNVNLTGMPGPSGGTAFSITGTASQSSAGTAAFGISSQISSTASNTKTASAAFTQKMAVKSTAVNTKSASAAFTQKMAIRATAVNTKTATATIGLKIPIHSTAVNSKTASAAFSLREKISSTASNASHATATLTLRIKLAAAAHNSPTATAALSVNKAISAVAFNTPVATADFIAAPRSPQHLGGTVTLLRLDGSVVVLANTFGGNCVIDASLGGSVAIPTIDASIVIPSYGGNAVAVNDFGGNATLITPNLGGGANEWTMQEVDITLNEFNDMSCALTITKNGSAYNLTGLEVDMFLKTAAGVPDNDVSTVKLSTTTGEITITNAAGGLATAIIPDADMDTTNIGFYRVDVIDGSGNRNTALFGKVTIIPL